MNKRWIILSSQLAFLIVIGFSVSWQARMVDRKIVELSELKDPSPFTAQLFALLNQVNVNLMEFMQNRNQAPLETLVQNEKLFEASLPEFQQQNPRLFPKTSQTKILDAYYPFKQALSDILNTHYRQAQLWSDLLANEDQMIFWIEHRLRPIVRKDQADAVARLDLLLSLGNQLRAIPKDLNQYVIMHTGDTESQMSQSDKRFEESLRRYRRMSLIANERKALEHLDKLRTEALPKAQDILRLEKAKSDAFSHMASTHRTLQSTISTTLPAVRPEELEAKKKIIARSMTIAIILIGITVLFGLVSSIVVGVWLYRHWHERATPHASTSEEGTDSTPIEIRMNLQGVLLDWNKQAERLYGHPASKAVGQSISMLFGSEKEIKELYEKMKNGQDTTFDTTHVSKNKKTFLVRMHFTPVVDSYGQTNSIALTIERR